VLARRLYLLALCGAAAGCGTKGAVSLNASIQNVDLRIEQVTLGTHMLGSFDLRLALGSEASGSTTVTLESFALVRATDGSTVLSPLPAAPAPDQFPVELAKGSELVVPFQFDGQKLLDPNLRDQICAQTVQIVGAIGDSASGDTLPLASNAFLPDGC
jgi:hypothetical protein